jgi:hypothetical protein
MSRADRKGQPQWDIVRIGHLETLAGMRACGDLKILNRAGHALAWVPDAAGAAPIAPLDLPTTLIDFARWALVCRAISDVHPRWSSARVVENADKVVVGAITLDRALGLR